jgi:hypothetical protein
MIREPELAARLNSEERPRRCARELREKIYLQYAQTQDSNPGTERRAASPHSRDPNAECLTAAARATPGLSGRRSAVGRILPRRREGDCDNQRLQSGRPPHPTRSQAPTGARRRRNPWP